MSWHCGNLSGSSKVVADAICYDIRNLYLSREGAEMDAIIGKYRVSMEETGLILTHPAGISFDLTLKEAIELMEFIRVYQDAIDEESNASERTSGEHELPK
jgi:hypothetical protein